MLPKAKCGKQGELLFHGTVTPDEQQRYRFFNVFCPVGGNFIHGRSAIQSITKKENSIFEIE